MKYSTGLAVSLSVLLTGFFTWGVSTHPDGFGGLIKEGPSPDPGAVPLALIDADKKSDSLTYADVAATVAQPAIFPFPPPNEQSLDKGFLAFLKDLKASVDAGDVEAVLAASHLEISYSFGANPSREGFRRELENTVYGMEIMDDLKRTLALPAGRVDFEDYKVHCTPYFWCMDLPEEAGVIDPYETVFVMGENVPVYAEASETSSVVTHLTHSAVRALDIWDYPGWVLVSLEGEEKGYVAADKTRSLLDYRAVFEEEDGNWSMTVFIAGD